MAVIDSQLSKNTTQLSPSNKTPVASCYIMGTTTLPIQCAELLLAQNIAIYGLITADKLIIEWGQKHSIPVHNPDDDLAKILSQKPFDYFFNIINFKIIPDEVLKLAQGFNVNYHDGPLPRYAGINATSWALINNETNYGITWHIMAEKLDAGDILEQEAVDIVPEDRAHTLNARCYESAIRAFSRLTQKIASNTVQPIAQDLTQRTYYELYERLPAVGTIRWNQPASDIAALIHALDFGIYDNNMNLPKVLIDNDVYFVKDAKVILTDADQSAGTIQNITDTSMLVSADDNAVELTDFLSKGGKSLAVRDVVEAHQLSIGSQLPLISEAQADKLTSLFKQVVKHERFWLRQIKSFKPTELPYINWIGAGKHIAELNQKTMPISSHLTTQISKKFPHYSVDTVLFGGLVAYLLRLCHTSTLHIGYSSNAIQDFIDDFQPYFEGIIPLQLEGDVNHNLAEFLPAFTTQLGKIQKRGTYLKELPVRYPQDRLVQPDYPIIIHQDTSNHLDSSSLNCTLVIHINDGEWQWEYDPQMLSANTIDTMQETLLVFWEQMFADESLPLTQPLLMSEKAFNQQVYDWNQTDANYPQDKCLHQLFEEQVALTPNNIALVWQNQSITYAELEQRANQLAHYLQQQGVTIEDFVGIYLNRSIDMIVALIATHKAGAAYIPLDPSYPANRIALMIEDSGTAFIIANSETANILSPDGHQKVISLDDDAEHINAEPTEQLKSEVTSENLAYVIYTSGSTGKPKGVMVRHRNVANFFTGMDEKIEHDPPGVWLAVTSISFDISVLEIFYTLARGFKVVVYSDDATNIMPATKYPSVAMEFSLFFFGSHESTEQDKYRLVRESTLFADANGLSAVWTPERHFHAFGGLYPNPSVLSAGLATITQNVKLRSGSIVSPLHDTIRIAENWSIVDNLSNGRVGLSFASGWQPNDFVLAPNNFENRKDLMFEQIEEVRHLWKGGEITRTSPIGKEVTLRILPHPIQDDLPVWITAAGNPETFRLAGHNGYNLLTHLLGQTFEELGEKIDIYREAWKQAGHPGDGHVTLMLHTYIDEDQERAREIVRGPMKDYLRSSLNLIKQAAWSFPTFKQMTTDTTGNFALEHLSESELNDVLDYSFERYYETSGLFGTTEQCLTIVDQCKEIGVNEIGCLIDYLVDDTDTLAHLSPIKTVLDLANPIEDPTPDEIDYTIPALIQRHKVSHLQCTPSMATMLATPENAGEYLGQLKQFMIGGEAFPKTLALQLEPIVTGQIINMYGPTETTIWSSTYNVENAKDLITIGRPIANTQLYILDAYHQIVPMGVAGELVIGGAGVVRGYLKRPDLTDERFIPNPFSDDPEDRMYKTGDRVRYLSDGQVEYLGRIDHQVKIRGYRIETGEIEARLSQYPAIHETVVIARDDSAGNKQLIAYFTSNEEQPPSTTNLRAFLSTELPDFMIPARFMMLDTLPLTPNGKIDRLALPEIGESRPEISESFVIAEDEIEHKLTDIWSHNLDVSPIGVTDNFFELGGHSLLAVRVVATIKQDFGVTLPLATFFKAPTIRALADILRQENVQISEFKSLVEIQNGNSDKSPLFCVHAHGGHVLFYYDVARYLGEDHTFYGLQAYGIDGTDDPLKTIEDMASHYVREIQMVQPHGPYYIGGDCLGGVIAFEMALQLRAKGEEIALVAMVDSYCPVTHPRFRKGVNESIYDAGVMAQRIYGFYLKRWWKLPAPEKRRMEADILKKVKFRVENLMHKLRGGSSESSDNGETSIYAVHEAHDNAIRDYVPRTYQGDVVLINADVAVLGTIHDRDMGWSPYVDGSIDIHEFSGYFNTGFYEPSVQHLAEILKELLDSHA